MDNALVLFPGALGDFMCALPSLYALRGDGIRHLTVAAKPSLLELLPADFDRFSIERREVADLFASSPPMHATGALFSGFAHIHSWTGSRDARFIRRLEAVSGAHVAVHPFRGMQPNEHAVHYYARCAGVLASPCTLGLDPAAVAWADSVLPTQEKGETLLIHAGSGSTVKNWEGFPPLAHLWHQRGRVMWIVGPADATPNASARDTIVHAQPLPRIAALLQRAPRYVGNDSGISHLAAAVGAHGLALFGASDPIVWGPLQLHVLHTLQQCSACGPVRFCAHRLPVDVVHAALLSMNTRDT